MTELSCSLTPTELDTFASAIFDLSRGQGERSPREIVARALFDLTGAERLASYRWDVGRQRYHKPLLINLSPAHGQHYIDVLQDCDPITPRMRRHKAATRIEDVLPKQDFERLEFYNEFLRPDDMYHGVNVFLRTGRYVVCDFRIFRGRSSPAFSQRELVLIDAMNAYLVKAMDQPVASDLDVLTGRKENSPSWLRAAAPTPTSGAFWTSAFRLFEPTWGVVSENWAVPTGASWRPLSRSAARTDAQGHGPSRGFVTRAR